MNTTIETTNPPTDHQLSTINNQPTINDLPKPTRDMINLMLEDALPYRVILDELAETGRDLTAQTLAQWVQTGHQDHLKNRQTIDAAKTEAEFAADLVRELGQIDASVIHRASMILVAIQLFNAIDEHGEKALMDMVRINPASYINILNALCNMVGPTIKLEEHCRALESASTSPPAKP